MHEIKERLSDQLAFGVAEYGLEEERVLPRAHELVEAVLPVAVGVWRLYEADFRSLRSGRRRPSINRVRRGKPYAAERAVR